MRIETTGRFVTGLPRDPFRWKPKNIAFDMIFTMSKQHYVRAFQQWLEAKARVADSRRLARDVQVWDFYNDSIEHLEWQRKEVNGLVRLYLGCVEELYHRERLPDMVGY
jgi:protein-tyrosine-phosphatase